MTTSPLVKGYMALYNAVAMGGWAYVVALIARHFAAGGGPETLYAAVGGPLKLMTTSALLEVVHAAVGAVRSSVSTTVIQGAHPVPAAAGSMRRRGQ